MSDEDEALVASMKRAEGLLKHLVESRGNSSEQLVRLDIAVTTLQKEISEILLIVRGRQGVEVRLPLIEERLSRIETSGAETTRGKWSLLGVLVTGILTLIAVVIGLVFKR